MQPTNYEMKKTNGNGTKLDTQLHGNGKLTKGYHGMSNKIFFEYPRSTHDYGPSGIGNNYWDTNDAAKYCTNKKFVKNDETHGKGGKQWMCLGHLPYEYGVGKVTNGYHGNTKGEFWEYPTSTHDFSHGIGSNHWDTNNASIFCTNKHFLGNDERWGKGGKRFLCLGHGPGAVRFNELYYDNCPYCYLVASAKRMRFILSVLFRMLATLNASGNASRNSQFYI